jgi:hypothetical protein
MQGPSTLVVAGVAVLSLGLMLARRVLAASRQRRRINVHSMRVHVALKRYSRQIQPGPDGLRKSDLRRMRKQLDARQLREWDEAMLAYEEARRDAPTSRFGDEAYYKDATRIAAELDRLLALGMRR